MDAHERWYYELYNNEHFYNDIRNTLMTLMSLDIDNFEDAIHELYYYCDITHRPANVPICESCEIIKRLLEEAEEHPEVFLFYHGRVMNGRASSSFDDD